MTSEEAVGTYLKNVRNDRVSANLALTEVDFLAGHASRDLEVAELKRQRDSLADALKGVVDGNDIATERGLSLELWKGSVARFEAQKSLAIVKSIIESKGETNERT